MKLRSVFIIMLLNSSLYGQVELFQPDSVYKIKTVKIKGNSVFDTDKLLNLISTKPSGFLNKKSFYFSQLLKDVSVIDSFYFAHGYRAASSSIERVIENTLKRYVDVYIKIHEGPVTRISNISFTGNTIDELTLCKWINLQGGMPYDLELLERSVVNTKDSFSTTGHFFSNVIPQSTFDTTNSSVSILFTINEGPIVRVGDLQIIGLKGIHESVVERELTIKKGEIITLEKVEESISRLYKTGLFKYVYIDPLDTALNSSKSTEITAPIIVQVIQASMIGIQAGGGYDPYEHFYLTIQGHYKNLWARGHSISVRGNFSQVLRTGNLWYSYPWFLTLPITMEMSGYVDRRNHASDIGAFQGGTLRLSHFYDRSFFYRIWTNGENVSELSEPPPTPNYPSTQLKPLFLLCVNPGFDNRISELKPGTSTFISAEISGAGLGVKNSYKFYKTVFDARGYWAFEQWSIASAILVGYGKGYSEDRGLLPAQQRFRIGTGDIRMVRGYTSTDISPKDENGNIRGGDFTVILNPLQVQIPFFYNFLAFEWFADAGHLWRDINDFSPYDLNWSTGPGLFIDVPFVGMVRVDYGFVIRKGKLGDGGWSFGFGLPF